VSPYAVIYRRPVEGGYAVGVAPAGTYLEAIGVADLLRRDGCVTAIHHVSLSEPAS
jgi:hypothetical protein